MNSIEAAARWITIGQAVRLTGLSDQTLRAHCAKGTFPSRRMPEGWELEERGLRAAQIIDIPLAVRHTGVKEALINQFYRLEKIELSDDGKLSLDQVAYIVENAAGIAAAPSFEPRPGPAPIENLVARDAATGSPNRGQRFPIAERPSDPVWSSFARYMTTKNIDDLPDEIFCGAYAPAFIPPLDVIYFVAIGFGFDEECTGTRVRQYAYWTLSRDKASFKRIPETDFLIPGAVARGAIPDEFAGLVEEHRQLEAAWQLRSASVRGSLAARSLVSPPFLAHFSESPDVGGCLKRYEEELFPPSRFPESVATLLVDVDFHPPIGVFRFEATGEHGRWLSRDGLPVNYAFVERTAGWDDHAVGPCETAKRREPMAGEYAKGEVPLSCCVANARYAAFEQDWELMRVRGAEANAVRAGSLAPAR
jgi:hypothetical protein